MTVEGTGDDLSDIYRDLNARFYSASAGNYLHTRWLLLGAMAGNGDGVDTLLREGARFHGIVFTPEARVVERSSDQDLAFLVTESQALLHHASETLLRLAFAHIGRPPCPWLEIARLRLPREFKDSVAQMLSWPTDKLERTAAYLFVGNPSSELADVHGPIMARLLRAAGKEVTDRAAIYNSVKHGLSVVAGESGLWFMSEVDPEARAGGQGPSITFLDSVRTAEGRAWSEHTEWIDLRSDLLLTRLLIMAIEAIWAIAAASYADCDLQQVVLPTEAAVNTALLERGSGHGMVHWRRGLFEEFKS